MQINPHVSFIAEERLEAVANGLLERYEREIAPIVAPPVPVEKIADFLLDLRIEWLDMPDTDDEPVLAYLHPESKSIRFNERRLDYFEQYLGTYEYTLAHEIGHYLFHLTPVEMQSQPVKSDKFGPGQAFLCRYKPAGHDQREWQAEQFASYLLMPAHLLLPAIEAGGVNVHSWPDLYRLRDQFNVSITALRIRLEKLGYLYVAANGRLYPTKAAASDDCRRDHLRLVSQGNLYRDLGEAPQARAAYQQALDLAREIEDKRGEAFCAWELGRLYAETDPAQAATLMAICVAYEREIGHPEAEADAAQVAQLEAQSQRAQKRRGETRKE